MERSCGPSLVGGMSLGGAGGEEGEGEGMEEEGKEEDATSLALQSSVKHKITDFRRGEKNVLDRYRSLKRQIDRMMDRHMNATRQIIDQDRQKMEPNRETKV